MCYNESLFDLQGTAGVLVYTSYKVCGILSAMPKKPNDDKALYTYAGLVLSYSSLNYTRICHAKKTGFGFLLFCRFVHCRTWLRGSLLILVFMGIAWTLRLLDLESSSPTLSYAASLSLVLEGIAILVFHSLKSEDVRADEN
jgi:hypothetical protein